MVKVVNENEFKNEVKEGVVVVDFFATWCSPCKMLAPIIDGLAEEMDGSVKFLKVDVDECSSLADQYNITNIPAVAIFKDGQKQDLVVGFSPREHLIEKIENCIEK